MIQSMTGFGSAERDVFKVEIRSVNHRFLDVSMKIPQNLSPHEMPLRNLIKERFSRGRFDVLVSMIGEGSIRVRVNRDLAREIHRTLFFLKDELSLEGTIGIDTIAGFKELILTEEMEYNTEPLYEAFREALLRLEDMRVREGELIAKDILSRVEVLRVMTDKIALLSPDLVSACRLKFVERLHDLFGEAKFDEGRVLQEASIMAEKTDISEEVMRIRSHVSQMNKDLMEGGTIGRKVEFLLQELNREVNTIASKANDYGISNLAVEMKSELEKMREQAQNIQ